MKSKKLILFFAIIATSNWIFAQKNQNEINSTDSTVQNNYQTIEEVIIKTNQLQTKNTNNNVIGKTDLSLGNSGRDIPVLLQQLPNVITTSDAGNGIGYTGIRVRGSDATRTNVTVNGVPINDAESQGTFWVNMPDLVSSAGSITLQRGLGTSLSGAGAFGASLHVQTDENTIPQFNVSYGSYNSKKLTGMYGNTFQLNKQKFIKINARVSYIHSDGFIDRASSNLAGYLASASYYTPNYSVKLLAFGGMEKTYQAWYGIPIEKFNLGNPNRKNTAADTTALWNHYYRNIGYVYNTSADSSNLFQSSPNKYNYYQYPNQTDNYQQHHVHLYLNNKLSNISNINTTLYYTHGEGYYAEYRNNNELSKYGLPPITTSDSTKPIKYSDLTRQRWLKNNLIGLNTNYTIENKNSLFTLGLSANYYVGQHYGIVDSVFSANPNYNQTYLPFKYYQNTAYKTDISLFAKYAQKISTSLNYYIDLQGRKVIYNGSGLENDSQHINFVGNYTFMNPKAGLNYTFQKLQTPFGNLKSSLNASFGMGYKEPARTDFTDNQYTSIPKPEQLLDYELGFHFDFIKANPVLNLEEYSKDLIDKSIRIHGVSVYNLNINGYYMDYRNQLVLSGALNDVGSALRVNVPKSYRTGVEIDGSVPIFENFYSSKNKISHEIRFIGNIALSKNIIENAPASWMDYSNNQKIDSNFHNAPISYSPSYVGSMGINYDIKFWDRTKTENKIVSILKSRLNIRFMTKFVGKQYLDNTGDESRKLDAYNFSELMINYYQAVLKNNTVNFKLQINNLFNQYYANNGYTWGYFYGRENLFQEVYLFPSALRNISVSVGYTF